MEEFSLAREKIEEIIDYNVLISTFENGMEQRRIKHSNALIGFKIQSPILTKTQLNEYRDFFIARYGSYDPFYFTSPFDDVHYTVRFEANSFKSIYSAGVFQCTFNFMRVL